MDWAETPFLTSGNEKGRRFFGLSKPTKRRPNICDSFSAMMPLFSREKSSLKGRWRLETVQVMRSSSSNPVSCPETSIKIYGSKEEIRARVSCTASTRLVTTTFRRAYAERGYPQSLTFHSDRGGQYISAAFSKLLQQYGVKQSFFRKRHASR